MISLEEKFRKFIEDNKLFTQKDKLLVAVSGGIDSMSLIELLYQNQFVFDIAHCNYKLRAEDSENDALLVKKISKIYSCHYYLKEFDMEKECKVKKMSVQETARVLRYEWFETLRKEKNYSKIVTAHHHNDNIETFFLNLFRGTGIMGLRGIQSNQNNLVRPLLFARKNELIEFAQKNALEFRNDKSNLSEKYTRNKIRLKIIPPIEEAYKDYEETFINNFKSLQEVSLAHLDYMELLKKKILSKKSKDVYLLYYNLLYKYPFYLDTLIWELIKEFGFQANQIEEIKKLIVSKKGSFLKSPSYKIIKETNKLVIVPLHETNSQEYYLFNSLPKKIETEEGIFKFRILKHNSSKINLFTKPNRILLDFQKFETPLVLRKYKTGDYFYPFGMQKKKKVKKYFIDKKLSLQEKEKIWIVEFNNKIAWIVDFQMDERFKVLDKTKELLEISFDKLG